MGKFVWEMTNEELRNRKLDPRLYPSGTMEPGHPSWRVFEGEGEPAKPEAKDGRTRIDQIKEYDWDTPGLPPRQFKDRCKWHPPFGDKGVATGGCAFRDDDPNKCEFCHQDLDVHVGSRVCKSSKKGYLVNVDGRPAKRAIELGFVQKKTKAPK